MAGYWVQNDGTTIAVQDMSDAHLQNAHSFVARRFADIERKLFGILPGLQCEEKVDFRLYTTTDANANRLLLKRNDFERMKTVLTKEIKRRKGDTGW